LRYIRCTIHLPLILRADSLIAVKWWVDASFATHGEFRGHTGATISMGRGSLSSMSRKQKINTRSSTEAELVGADDAMPQIIWTKYFIEAQGHVISENILYKDNLSTMLLEKNGKKSSSKRTKHIGVRYFFIKDRVDSGDLTIKHFATEVMIGDHFTRSLQGALLHKLRAEVQGIPTDLSNVELGWDREGGNEGIGRGYTDPSPQECVGKAPTSVSTQTGLSERYGKPNLIHMSKILDAPPATSTSLCTCDVGTKVSIGGRSNAQVLMRTR
jgi:hypothetical protein